MLKDKDGDGKLMKHSYTNLEDSEIDVLKLDYAHDTCPTLPRIPKLML